MDFDHGKLVGKILFLWLSAVILLTGGCQSSSKPATTSSRENKTIEQTQLLLLLRVSAPGANAAEPAVEVDANGTVYVVYVEHSADKTADIYLQKFDSEGKTSGEKVRVNPQQGQVKAWYGDPPTIKIGSDRAIYVGWTAKAEAADRPGATLLNLSVSRNGGKSFEAPVKVNDDTAPAAHGMHSLALGENGRIFVAWLDERNIKTEPRAVNSGAEDQKFDEPGFQFVKIHHNSNQTEKPKEATKPEKKPEPEEASEPNSEVFFAFSDDGGKTFSPNKKLSSEVCPCCKTSLLAAPDGKIYVSWRQVLPGDFRHIAVAASVDKGASFSAPVIVSDDKWQINACPVSGATMAADRENTLEIVWYTAGDAGKPGLYRSESKDGGQTFKEREFLSGETLNGTPVLLSTAEKNFYTVFPAADNRTILASTGNERPPDAPDRQTIDNSEAPNAVLRGNKLFIAFARQTDEKSEVWLFAKNLYPAEK